MQNQCQVDFGKLSTLSTNRKLQFLGNKGKVQFMFNKCKIDGRIANRQPCLPCTTYFTLPCPFSNINALDILKAWMRVPPMPLCLRGCRPCLPYRWWADGCWGVSERGEALMLEGGWRSTSLRERDCLPREEPRRREEWRSTRALSLRATFLRRPRREGGREGGGEGGRKGGRGGGEGGRGNG